MVRICTLGREQVASLRGHVDLALADSEFSRKELEEAGFERTGVLPIFLDFARYREAPSPVLRRQLDDGRTNILFVGRLAPNKRQEDLVRLASFWKRFVSPAVRLVLVGRLPRRTTGHGQPLRAHYFDALQALAYEEGLTPEEVIFTGHADHADLLACYAAADVFVSMSEHEGFGVPLVEAMLMRVPVLARRAAAVAWTLGEGGITFEGRDVAEVAELGHLLATDGELRSRVLAAQDRRLSAFAPAAVEAELRRYVDSL
jgi:glycosyltransferase involved in cell wall biosynthesis